MNREQRRKTGISKSYNYDFFEVLDNIDGKVVDPQTNEEKLIPLLYKGEIVMRVGAGVVAPELPISTIYTIPWKPLLKKKLLKELDNMKERKELAEGIFKDIIQEVTHEVSTSVLTMIESHAGFIKIPENLHGLIKETLNMK